MTPPRARPAVARPMPAGTHGSGPESPLASNGAETGVPVAFGVLTLDRADQAESRQAKGADAVRTALEMADLFANLRAAAAR